MPGRRGRGRGSHSRTTLRRSSRAATRAAAQPYQPLSRPTSSRAPPAATSSSAEGDRGVPNLPNSLDDLLHLVRDQVCAELQTTLSTSASSPLALPQTSLPFTGENDQGVFSFVCVCVRVCVVDIG